MGDLIKQRRREVAKRRLEELAARSFRIIALIGALATLLLVGFTLLASDLTPGYVFVPAEKNVTSTKLNSLVNAAVINSTFITDKPASTAPVPGDLLLIYSQAAQDLRRVALADAFINNTALIANQVEDLAPNPTNYFLELNVLATNAATFNKIRLGTLLLSLGPVLTNLVEQTAAVGGDQIWLWDSVSSTSKRSSLAGLVTNLPAAAAPTNTDLIAVYSQGSSNLSKMPLSKLVTGWTNVPSTNVGMNDVVLGYNAKSNTVATFTLGSLMAWTAAYTNDLLSAHYGAGRIIYTNHSLGVVPTFVRCVVVCRTNDSQFVVGDEIDASAIWTTDAVAPLSWGANASSAWVDGKMFEANYGHMYCNGSNSVSPATLNLTNWLAKLYVRP